MRILSRCVCSRKLYAIRTMPCRPRSVIMRSNFARMTSSGASARGFAISSGGGGIGGALAALAMSLDERPMLIQALLAIPPSARTLPRFTACGQDGSISTSTRTPSSEVSSLTQAELEVSRIPAITHKSPPRTRLVASVVSLAACELTHHHARTWNFHTCGNLSRTL